MPLDLRAYSGWNQTAPSGGTRRLTEAGRPCQDEARNVSLSSSSHSVTNVRSNQKSVAQTSVTYHEPANFNAGAGASWSLASCSLGIVGWRDIWS